MNLCVVSILSASLGNQVTRFAANYGMMNLFELSLVTYNFIPIHDLLDTDIGWGPHPPVLEEVVNFGLGEVI